ARGVIQHTFQPRRSTVYSDRILSISQWQLLSVDASDRDHPDVRATTTLAWPVDRVVLHGDFVIEVGAMDGWSWYGGSPDSGLRVAAANEPNRVLGQPPLGDLPVLSVTSRGERLYVLQGPAGYFYPYPVLVAGVDPGAPGDGTAQAKFTLTVVSL